MPSREEASNDDGANHPRIKASGASLRIVAEELHGHGSARFADPSSTETYSGSDALDAIRRLIENSPQWNVTLDDFDPKLPDIDCRSGFPSA